MTIARDLSKILDANGDLNIDANTLFVDSSTNRVGIGTSSPSRKLHISTSEQIISRFTTTNTLGLVSIEDTNTTGENYVSVGSEGNNMFFRAGGSEKLRIDSSGNVGIGTSSPKRSLQIGDNTDSLEILSIQSTTSGSSRIYFGSNDGTNAEYSGYLWYDHSNDSLRIATDSTERMRIDSSGNVLVNTTDTSLYNNTGASDGGFAINDSRGSYVQIARDDGAQLFLNLLGTNDGALIGFYRSGTQVGSIRAEDGDIIFGNDTRGLKYRDADVIPRNMNDSTADNIVDLGSSTSRFKNLLLGGSVYLGGTGSANALDDYEEGTFNMTLEGGTGNPTVSYYERSASYTKIGNIVQVHGVLYPSSISGGSGNVIITGFPFTASQKGVGSLIFDRVQILTTGTGIHPSSTTVVVEQSTTYMTINVMNDYTDETRTKVTISDLATNPYIAFSVTYRTTA